MQNLSLGQTVDNAGVEDGALRLLESLPDWLSDSAEQHDITFPSPQTLSKDTPLEEIAGFFEQVKQAILKDWKPGQTPIFLGGDHSISLLSLAAITERYNDKRIGLIHFDSHGDIHTSQTSPSGNFHGMWLRAVLDTFPVEAINNLIPHKIPVENWKIIGNPVLEQEEVRFMAENHVEAITSSRLQTDLEGVSQELTELLQRVDHLHISFDIDVFAASLVPGTGTPNPKGMLPNEIWPLISLLRTPLHLTQATYSVDLVEYNPRRDQKDKTLQLSLEVLERLLRD
jgi:arginase